MSWQIDLAHSSVGFSVRHMMITKVNGEFQQFSGTVAYDPEAPTNTVVDVNIELSSINTGNADRDNHLRSPDFFNVEETPHMSFVSKRVEQTGENKGKLIGDLTIGGTTREVALDVEYVGIAKNPMTGATTAGFSASGEISRQEFGLTWNVALESGGWLVGDKVKINIDLQIFTQPEGEGEEAVAAD
jgi:polyisoprenoid-binding protein YceI